MSGKTITSVEEMHAYAADVAASLKGGELLLLVGELGAGKTTFAQGLAKALGVTQQVTSPTFTIISEYSTTHDLISRLVHLDLYRLEDGQADTDIAVQEALQEPGHSDHVTVVEWADRLASTPPGIVIRFSHTADETQRTVELDA